MAETTYNLLVVVLSGIGIVLLALILVKVHKQNHYLHDLNTRMKLFEEATEKEQKD